jgi:hypothetical protein
MKQETYKERTIEYPILHNSLVLDTNDELHWIEMKK